MFFTVFSALGSVWEIAIFEKKKIAIFEKNGGMQALIRYPVITTTTVAKKALEGHRIYGGYYS
ncbi:hypothetical protein QJS10_CPB18g01407 [Acorus calamus]|uniref:Uncharacterized protein n=1 Tax=Acorus calamus TaxID=4465 RepID=A0AAV9CNT7_ACOCL|nr:hypothetical protein QJS10_CPB18g01407 [Acorus calamus]